MSLQLKLVLGTGECYKIICSSSRTVLINLVEKGTRLYVSKNTLKHLVDKTNAKCVR